MRFESYTIICFTFSMRFCTRLPSMSDGRSNIGTDTRKLTGLDESASRFEQDGCEVARMSHGGSSRHRSWRSVWPILRHVRRGSPHERETVAGRSGLESSWALSICLMKFEQNAFPLSTMSANRTPLTGPGAHIRREFSRSGKREVSRDCSISFRRREAR